MAGRFCKKRLSRQPGLELDSSQTSSAFMRSNWIFPLSFVEFSMLSAIVVSSSSLLSDLSASVLFVTVALALARELLFSSEVDLTCPIAGLFLVSSSSSLITRTALLIPGLRL